MAHQGCTICPEWFQNEIMSEDSLNNLKKLDMGNSTRVFTLVVDFDFFYKNYVSLNYSGFIRMLMWLEKNHSKCILSCYNIVMVCYGECVFHVSSAIPICGTIKEFRSLNLKAYL